jgi:ubiquitin-like domain-containing CTD phosphatase 1
MAEEYNPNTWYKKYSSYPPYCATFDEMQTRSIPMLREHDQETRILHATAVIRHGARTPSSSKRQCWDGYWDSAETGVWDCDLTTIMAPPSLNRITQEEGDTCYYWDTDNSFFLFEKQYDALQYPQDGLTNELNGTCQMEQLLLQGYEQEIRNGRILRDAYTFRSDDPWDHDERMRLIDLSFDTFSPWDPYHLRYRSDDSQRTLMSGQVLLRGLFDEEVMSTFYKTGMYPQITVHTADRIKDILNANEHVCPKLKTIVERALQSEEYQAWNSSQEVTNIRKFMNVTLGKLDQHGIVDCLMTTICTDRSLPEAIDDYGKHTGDSMFEALADFVSSKDMHT